MIWKYFLNFCLYLVLLIFFYFSVAIFVPRVLWISVCLWELLRLLSVCMKKFRICSKLLFFYLIDYLFLDYIYYFIYYFIVFNYLALNQVFFFVCRCLFMLFSFSFFLVYFRLFILFLFFLFLPHISSVYCQSYIVCLF